MGKKVLGRGLDALISNEIVNTEEIVLVDINEIEPNPFQPRITFTREEIESLAESIKKRGVLQPVILRKTEGKYQLIAGERRWRAAKVAGLTRIPARVVEINDNDALEIALVENLDRKDLNPIELARGYTLLKEKFGLTQEEIAQKIGKSRSSVANTMRLLQLSRTVQDMILEGKLTEGQARPLIGLPDELQTRLARMIVEKGLNARQVEDLVKKQKERTRERGSKDLEISRIISKYLTDRLRYRVKVKFNPTGKSRVTFEFKNMDELKKFISGLVGEEIDFWEAT